MDDSFSKQNELFAWIRKDANNSNLELSRVKDDNIHPKHFL